MNESGFRFFEFKPPDRSEDAQIKNDAPSKLAEVEQRDGRILRQGNENAVAAIYRYVTGSPGNTRPPAVNDAGGPFHLAHAVWRRTKAFANPLFLFVFSFFRVFVFS